MRTKPRPLDVRSLAITAIFLACSDAISESRSIAQDEPAATLTLGELYDGAIKSQQPLHSINVAYKYTTRVVGGDPPAGSKIAIGSWDKVFKLKSEKRMAGETPLQRDPKDTLLDQTFIFDGETGYAYRPGQLLLFDGKAPNSDNTDFYCEEVLCIPVTDIARATLDNAVSFPYSLSSEGTRSKFSVKESLEKIDGAMCHIVECPGRLKVWVDPQHGFCVRRREKFAANGELLAAYDYGRFEEVLKDIWLPRYCLRSTTPFRSKELTLETIAEVDQIRIGNQVLDSDFNIRIPPGTMVVGQGKGFVVRGDNASLLDVFAEELVQKRKIRQTPTKQLLIIANVLVVLVTISYFLLRHRKLSKISPTDS